MRCPIQASWVDPMQPSATLVQLLPYFIQTGRKSKHACAKKINNAGHEVGHEQARRFSLFFSTFEHEMCCPPARDRRYECHGGSLLAETGTTHAVFEDEA